MSRRILLLCRLLVGLTLLAALLAPLSTAQAATDPRYFPQTGFRISDDAFWDYFQKRGGVRTFGYPVSRKFQFLGSEVQFFQRRIVQKQANGSVGQLNLLDSGLMPYTSINGAKIPPADPELLKTAPQVGSATYALDVLNWLRANSPETWDGKNVV